MPRPKLVLKRLIFWLRLEPKEMVPMVAALNWPVPTNVPLNTPSNSFALNHTERVLAPVSALIRSGGPSPLTSAAVTHHFDPAELSKHASTKPPLPLFVSTESVVVLAFALTKSTLPSPFTSTAVTQ